MQSQALLFALAGCAGMAEGHLEGIETVHDSRTHAGRGLCENRLLGMATHWKWHQPQVHLIALARCPEPEHAAQARTASRIPLALPAHSLQAS